MATQLGWFTSTIKHSLKEITTYLSPGLHNLGGLFNISVFSQMTEGLFVFNFFFWSGRSLIILNNCRGLKQVATKDPNLKNFGHFTKEKSLGKFSGADHRHLFHDQFYYYNIPSPSPVASHWSYPPIWHGGNRSTLEHALFSYKPCLDSWNWIHSNNNN